MKKFGPSPHRCSLDRRLAAVYAQHQHWVIRPYAMNPRIAPLFLYARVAVCLVPD